MRAGGGEGEPADLKAVKFDIVHYTRGIGVELGRGMWKAFPHFIGVREKGDETAAKPTEFDLQVDSFSAMEGIKDECLDFVFVWSDVTTSVEVRAEVRRMLKRGGYFVRAEGGQKLIVEQKVLAGFIDVDWNHREPKAACVVRHGAIGDTLQAASVLPQLKADGYHVTWMCEPLGQDLLQHDPHIDRFLIQDKDQVPNHELTAYWKRMAERFDKFINLSESVEGTLIALPGRPNYMWPKAVRDEMCGHNYLEFTAKLADQLFRPAHHFYASQEEKDDAGLFISRIADQVNPNFRIGMRYTRPFVIMWALNGSSFHKVYPHQDAVIARTLLEIPQAHIVLVGDHAAKLLEQGWEDEKRVHRMAGEMAIRATLALANRCDLVIGPETGVLNSVAFEAMAKVMLLSHSSVENLTKHWVNTESVHADVPCYPCHRLHYTREHCPQHEPSGTSMCMADLPPNVVWGAVQRAFIGWSTVHSLLAAA